MSRVIVGIVTYNSMADLPLCLAALEGQSYQPVECRVLDNASSDGVALWMAEHAPHINFVQNTANAGFGNGHNRILAQADLKTGDYYMTLNPDVRLEADYIARVVYELALYGTDWGTGTLIQMDQPTRLYSIGHALRRDGYALNIGYGYAFKDLQPQSAMIFGAPGAAAIYRAPLIYALSVHGALFDSQLFMYNEDVDLDWRAQRAGFTCRYIASARAVHRGSRPDQAARIEALKNRYASVIKNAWLQDLLLFNLPIMIAHCLVRLFVTPRAGLHLITRLLRIAPTMWRQRTKPHVPRRVLAAWFRQAERVTTVQPKTWRARLTAFRHAR